MRNPDAAKVTKPSDYQSDIQKILMSYQAKLPKDAGVVLAGFDAATTGRLALTYYSELQASDFWTGWHIGTIPAALCTVLKECLRTLFVNDASSARPEGSMEVYRLYWWEHNCKDGQYSSAAVHRSVEVKLKDGVMEPKCAEDYEITVLPLDGLTPEVVHGI